MLVSERQNHRPRPPAGRIHLSTTQASSFRRSLQGGCRTDAEWASAQAFLPPPSPRARPRRWAMRLLLDAVLYVLRTGCAWRHLPRDFPPWQTVLRWFLRLARSGAFERMAELDHRDFASS